jgi:hypothetical protein
VNDTAHSEDPHEELSFSDLSSFGGWLALGQFDESNTRTQIDVCRTWLVAQHAEVRRWMCDFRMLWPPMHGQLNKLHENLQRQNKQI